VARAIHVKGFRIAAESESLLSALPACVRTNDSDLTQPMEANVAKGQIKSNREIRKPKKTVAKGPAAGISSVSSAFAKAPKTAAKGGKR
jgi:hypothetical protein